MKSVKQYTDEEKARYWKNKAMATSSNPTRKTYRNYSKPYKNTGRKTYTKKTTAKKNTGWLANGLGTAGSVVGGLLGAAEGGIGAIPGAALGGALGGGIGNAITYFTGFGDYKIKKNALMPAVNGNVPIRNTRNNKLGGTVFQKSEYLGEVVSGAAGTFDVKTYQFNPGNPNMFPWLSQIASNYQQYIVEGCYIEYRSMSGNALNSVNTALGQVIMSSQYNSNDPDFESKQEMENYEYGCSVVPSRSVMYFFECARGQNVLDNLYIRSTKNTVQSNDQPVPIDDIRFEDLCKFSIATNGLQGANVNLGELWITYQIRLLKTKLYDNLGLSNGNFRCANPNYDTVNPPFGKYTPIYDNIGMTYFGTGTLNGVEFPYNNQSLDYLVLCRWSGDTSVTINIVGVVHASPSAVISFSPVGYISAPDNGYDSNTVVRAYYLRTAGNGAPLRVYIDSSEAPVLPMGPNCNFYMEIIQMPRDYT